MSKKLPKAIRPNVTHRGGPEAPSRMAEPMPETRGPAKTEAGFAIAAEDLVATDIDVTRTQRTCPQAGRTLFSLFGGGWTASGAGRRYRRRRWGPAPDVAPHFADLRCSVFEKSRQSDLGESCRNDDPREHRTGHGQHGQEHTRRRNGNRCADHARAVRWRHLRDWHDFRRALRQGRDAA